MQSRTLTIPELILLAGARVAFGMGIGLLMANRLNRDQRMGAGRALVAVGALTTIPIAMSLLKRRETSENIAA